MVNMIKTDLLTYIMLSNPWLKDKSQPILTPTNYIPRIQYYQLIKPVWDNYITILIGPRQAGPEHFGEHLCISSS